MKPLLILLFLSTSVFAGNDYLLEQQGINASPGEALNYRTMQRQQIRQEIETERRRNRQEMENQRIRDRYMKGINEYNDLYDY